MISRWKRLLRHLTTSDQSVRRQLTSGLFDAIEAAIVDSETRHRGEIRFAVESGIEFAALLQGVSPRQRALEAFEHLGVGDTEEKSGVLIFVQLIDRRVEIVADRGVAQRVDDGRWRQIAAELEQAFAESRYLAGSLAAIEAVGEVLEAHFPAFPRNPNELPDRPMLI